MSRVVPVSLLLTGCLAGEVYPELYAEAYCQTAYACVGEEQVEEVAGYVDEEGCRSAVQGVVETDPKYVGFQDGDCSWDAESARDCLDELRQLRGEDTCDGTMDFAVFAVDAATPACLAVYGDCL